MTLSAKHKRFYRAIFISDIHLGTRDCDAVLVDRFLRESHCQTLYLVGDFIDIWRIKAIRYWPQEHLNVIRRIISLTRKYSQVIYTPGNHDEHLVKYLEGDQLTFGNLKVIPETIHEGLDGLSYMVSHGHQYDNIVQHHLWVSHLGEKLYQGAVYVNRAYNLLRRMVGLAPSNFSGYLKNKVKLRVGVLLKFEELLAKEAARRGLDGVICGHIHIPKIDTLNGVAYLNCGDFMESFTAVVETLEGEFQLLDIRRLMAEEEKAPEKSKERLAA